MKSLNLFCVDACEKEKGFAELSQLTRVGLGLGSLSVVRNGGCASQMGRRVPLHDLPGALMWLILRAFLPPGPACLHLLFGSRLALAADGTMTQELKAARVQQTTPSERHIREDWPAEFFGPVDNNVAVAVTGHTVTPAAERLAADLVDISRSVDLCDGLLTSHPEPVLSGLEEVLRQRAAVLVPWGNEGEDGLVLVGSPMPELLARLAKRLGPGYSVQAHCSGGAYRAWQATGFQDG